MKTITAQEARALIKAAGRGRLYLRFHFRGKDRLLEIGSKLEALAMLKGIAPWAEVPVETDSYHRVIIHADAPARTL